MGNYSYVIDSTFQPFSMQEMLVPFTAYKEAFEKTEEAYNDLSDKSDKFKYLSETLPEGSKARALYEGYANDLRQRAEDLAHNGLTMGNRRALTSMKRRYQGEIGRLLEADERLKEERKLRQSLNAQDASRIYSTENLSIDDFLDDNTPNLYNVSGKELYAAGAAAGKAASSRVFSAGDAGSTLNGYYIDYVQKNGYSPELIQKFYEKMSTIPELQRAAEDIAVQYGVDKNLTGYSLERATKSILRGMIDGAIYQESHSPQRDLGKLTAAEQSQIDLSRRAQDIDLASNGMTYDDKTKTITYNPTKDPKLLATMAREGAKGSGSESQKYAGYDKTAYISNENPPQNVDEIPNRAIPIKVNTKNGKYVASINYKGKNIDVGEMDAHGKFKLLDTKGELNKAINDKMSWYQWFAGYDEDYDPKNIKALLNDVVEVAKREGGKGYKNYNYYFEPDDASWSNGGGGFYREPLERVAGTTANENPETYKKESNANGDNDLH